MGHIIMKDSTQGVVRCSQGHPLEHAICTCGSNVSIHTPLLALMQYVYDFDFDLRRPGDKARPSGHFDQHSPSIQFKCKQQQLTWDDVN